MAISKLSSKGQVVLPKAVREALDWRPGLELSIEKGDDCVIIRRRRRVPVRTVEEVAGSLKYDGPPVSLEDMDRAIEAEVRERWRRKSR